MFCFYAPAVRSRTLAQALDERFIHISNPKTCHDPLRMLRAVNESMWGEKFKCYQTGTGSEIAQRQS
ncbi:hypothetical protein [Burkholderia multivorans]|uniref:hypothetical protein n=1 Tax=Burkholderia multivorans TaxID=87883 RepID=UPI0015E3804C